MKEKQGQLTQLILHETKFHHQLKKIMKKFTHFQHDNESFIFQNYVIIRDPLKNDSAYNITIYIYIYIYIYMKTKFNKREMSLAQYEITERLS